MPTYDEIREKLATIAAERSEWAGLPMLCEGVDLIVEPKFPYQFSQPKKEGNNFVNSWRNDHLGARVYVVRQPDGKSRAWISPNVHGIKCIMNTIQVACTTWDPKTELRAMDKLAEMVGEHKTKLYFLTGSFIERSQRSGLFYMFRKLRPTIVMTSHNDEMRLLCCLCAHPIGYYSWSWAGAMTPTDDVLAHLCLMRGDEHQFWKMSNQHPPHHPEAGL